LVIVNTKRVNVKNKNKIIHIIQVRVDDDTNCTRLRDPSLKSPAGSKHINSIKSTKKYDNEKQYFIYVSIFTKLPFYIFQKIVITHLHFELLLTFYSIWYTHVGTGEYKTHVSLNKNLWLSFKVMVSISTLGRQRVKRERAGRGAERRLSPRERCAINWNSQSPERRAQLITFLDTRTYEITQYIISSLI